MNVYLDLKAKLHSFKILSSKANHHNMKNILILRNSLDSHKTGVDRVSFLLKKELKCRGYNCFDGCVNGENTTNRKDVLEYDFNKSKKFVLKTFLEFIKLYNIDVVIIQGFMDANINNAILHLKNKSNCKFVFCLHNDPSVYKRKIPLSVLDQLKNLIWYFAKFQTIILDYRKYRLKMLSKMYNNADKFVLLSRNYVANLCKTIKIQNLNKIACINNLPTFKVQPMDFSKKKKQVLILCRLEEYYKNISAALRIWKRIEDIGTYGWNLAIVGTGVDEKKLKNYATTLNLKKAAFLGETSEPEKFYQESSLFMMTSHSEGWPMTLLEAQQYGCVPVAFNTFAALSEIIENEVNGYIIEKNNELQFVQTLIKLMKDEISLQKLSQNSLIKSQNYSSKAIGDKWESLLREL